ncbi:hypothetical protein, conserved, partial [Babesia bigemina]
QDGRKYFDGSQDRKKGVHTLLTELKNGLTEGVESVFTKGFEEIKNNVERLKSGHILDVLEKLNSLCDAVKNSSEFLTGNLGTLKNDVFDRKLKNLMHDLRELQQTKLAPLIDEAQRIRNSLNSQCKQCIWDIEMFVSQEVNRSTKAIQNEARKQYNAKISDVFEKLKAIVHYKTEEIKIVIEKDKKTGVKGFLRTIYGIKVTVITFALPEFQTSASLLAPLKQAFTIKIFKDLSSKFHAYVTNILPYIEDEIKIPPQPRSAAAIFADTDESKNVKKINEDLNNLLTNLIDAKQSKNYNYDHQFTSLLSTLSSSLTSLHPSAFANPRHPELLDAVRAGLQGFVEQMERVYVSRYEGYEEKVNMGKLVSNEDGKGEKLTDAGRNLSKVFLTILVTLKAGLDELKQNAPNAWRGRQIYLQDSNEDENSFGQFLNKCGYKVSKSHDSHEGHLRNKTGCTGQYIHDDLLVGDKQHIYHSDKNAKRALEILFDYLETYNDLCHLSTFTSKRQPCSVYEMLAWLSGLTHNPVHQSKLSVAIMNVLEELYKRGREDEGEHGDVLAVERQADGGEFKVSLVDARSVSLEAYPRDVSYDELWAAVTHICSTSYDVLCAIAGHGDEFTTYAVDYSNNYMNFNYPQNGEDCLDMLLDILRRMLPTLQYLYSQCKLSNGLNGWQSCKYGKGIMTAKWPCKVHPSDEPDDESNCQAKCKPTCQAKCEVTCQVDCQPTSPLMSYLNDCLPGHLPHQLTKIGCKYECANCSTSKKSKPCLTPLGFKGFSGPTRMGKDICEVLTKFINIKHLTGLFTLIPKPPSTLPEHFGFTLALANGINATSRPYNYDSHALRDTFAASIYEQTINLCTDQSTVTKALTDAYGSPNPEHGKCEYAHLKNLTTSHSCKGKINLELECAPYLANLSVDCYRYLGKKHSNLYLSWAVYLPWNFWMYLKDLYDAFCNIYCQDWGCRGCLRGDKCKRGAHGSISDASKQPNCQCHSIVDCRGVAPTLYSYGFSFGDPSKLQNENYPNTCADFCKQLKNVLKSDYFTKLFEECDKFLFTIRAPFIWLNVALWLLSLLYLIHIMVIRLDLLHIKSHLHSPSSHRIAAQSLLAAARVNKLNRVFYLQP